MGRFSFAAVLLGVGALSFFVALALVDDGRSRIPPPQPMGELTGETQCEVWFPAERCPAQPNLKGIDASGRLLDSYDGADRSSERCLKRAAEFHSWCKARDPIKVAFVRNGQTVMQKRYPQ